MSRLVLLALLLSGCALLDPQTPRQPDTRRYLGAYEWVRDVDRDDLDRYACRSGILIAESWGARSDRFDLRCATL